MLFDYPTVTPSSIREDVDATLARADELVNCIVESTDDPTYRSTLGVLDEIADITSSLFGRTAFMGYVHPDEETRSAGKELEERISEWGLELAFRSDLYEAITALSETEEASQRSGERKRFLEFSLRDFRKAGHELAPEDRARLKDLSNRLVELGVEFERNIAEWDDALVVTRDDLEGLPDWYA